MCRQSIVVDKFAKNCFFHEKDSITGENVK